MRAIGLSRLWALVLGLALLPALAQAKDAHVRIGVLAIWGGDRALEQWAPLADYLSRRLGDREFVIVPLNLDETGTAAAEGTVDFILTNPGNYVELGARHPLRSLATLERRRGDAATTQFGAVIFTRADRDDINTLADLRGKSFMAVKQSAFGGFQMAQRLLKDAGIDASDDFSPLMFSSFPQDGVAYAVAKGIADAGTVRTGTLEGLAATGQIELKDFKVLNPRTEPGFPFLLSSRLYPEWPFASLDHVPRALARQVAEALLAMPPDHPAAKAAGIRGWVTPLSYEPVHDLMRELRVGPYALTPPLTLAAVMAQYWMWLLAGAALLLTLAATTGYVLNLNRKLRRTMRELRIEEEKRKNFAHLSLVDPLTGLYNRRYANDALHAEIQRAGRHRGTLSVAMLDVDNFKQVNDRYGHGCGDAALTAVALSLRAHLRASDSATRYGGEEFLVILPETGLEAASAVAERVRAEVEGTYLPCRDGPVTLSGGVAEWRSGEAPEELIRRADELLYRAKQDGRNLICREAPALPRGAPLH